MSFGLPAAVYLAVALVGCGVITVALLTKRSSDGGERFGQDRFQSSSARRPAPGFRVQMVTAVVVIAVLVAVGMYGGLTFSGRSLVEMVLR